MTEYLTKQQLAATLNCSPRYLNLLMADRQIPFYRRGHLVRFRLAEVEGFLAGIRVAARNEPKRRAGRIVNQPINTAGGILA